MRGCLRVHHLNSMYEGARIDFGGMSGNQIMAFMSRVMRDVDGQLAAKADTLRERNAASAQIAEELAVLERLKMLGEEHGDDANLILHGSDNSDKIEGTDVRTFLEANGMSHLLDRIETHDRSGDRTGAYIKAGDIQKAIDQLKGRQNSLSSMSEMDMIQFQSIVQTRQLFVNLATQMMNSQHEGQSNVVRNIG